MRVNLDFERGRHSNRPRAASVGLPFAARRGDGLTLVGGSEQTATPVRFFIQEDWWRGPMRAR